MAVVLPFYYYVSVWGVEVLWFGLRGVDSFMGVSERFSGIYYCLFRFVKTCLYC